MENHKKANIYPGARPCLASSGAIFLAALLLSAVFLSACGFTVIPPPSPSNPAPVFLLDHGGHASLVLPADNGMVRYSYGDWNWYVLRRTGVTEGSRALFRSTPAGLSRKILSASPTAESVQRTLGIEIENIFLISADVERIARLRDRLDDIFDQNRQSLHHDPTFDLDFVRHPEPYSLGHNSNTVVAEWLRELGAEVRGGGPFSRWTIKEPH